uniref:Rho-GAP domain-containing protein n=1 Tax=Timema monikensis TaxID=170555 RepID=A0A7R9HLX9_9NEOP|nr:unnamed protein product [Timema monikensis]
MKLSSSKKMEFESPDVEKEFPGLYASESGRKSNESDFSDDGHDRLSKKDLLIGKRKDKKDRGYAALEGESSPDEDPDIKSPSKSKKSKSFKFPSKKEKREKNGKECDKDRKKDKPRLKMKERKKCKHGEESADVSEELPIFGVPLQLAVDRSRCHDGVDIPLVVRDCIDYVQDHGLTMENIYKLSGIKSKVQLLRRLYNQRENVKLADYEPPVVTSLFKQFLRELPEPMLTSELGPRFEEAAAVRTVEVRGSQLLSLVEQLPSCNRHLLSWVIVHLNHITCHDTSNKMNTQNLAISLSPVFQMSHRLLTTLLCHCQELFPDVIITKYVPPLSAGSPSLPDNPAGISEELKKQESLLNQIHQEMNAGFVSKSREELLWEVQRIITQLKRKLRSMQRAQDMSQTQRSLEESHKSGEDEFHMDLTLQKARSQDEQPCREPTEESCSTVVFYFWKQKVTLNCGRHPSSRSSFTHPYSFVYTYSSVLREEELQGLLQEETALQLEHRELLSLQSDLQGRVQVERAEIERLRTQLATKSFNENSSEGSSSDTDDPEEKKSSLVRRIMEEREACLRLRVQLSLVRLSQESKQL